MWFEGARFMSIRFLGKHNADQFDSTRSLAVFTFLLLACVSFSGCQRNRKTPPPPEIAVTVAKPVQHDVMEWDDYTGHLEAVESVEVRARVSGLVVKAPFQEGSIVKQGELLVELDVRPFQADLDARIAAEAMAAAKLKLADIQYTRLKRLLPENSASFIEFQTAEASLAQSKAELAAAKANVEAARLSVEWCHVLAPIAGRISRKYVTPGNLVTGGSGTGTLLTTIQSIDPIYCYVDADERSVLKYQELAREGKRVSARDAQIPAFLQLATETGFPHRGVIDFVDNRLDPTTGTMLARGVFPNPHGWLTPGFFARLRVPGSGMYKALLVPDEAIVTEQNAKSVLVVGPDDIVQSHPVTLGPVFGDMRVVESGIGSDDRVIVKGLLAARPGAKVQVSELTIPTASLPTIPADLVIPPPTTTTPASAPAPRSPA